MEEKIKLSNLMFGLYRKKTLGGFKSRRELLEYFEKRTAANLTDLSTFDSADKLDRYFRSPDSNLDAVIRISNTLYATNKTYASVLDYLSTIYYWRHRTLPRLVRDDAGTDEEYNEIYKEMLEIVDGTNIETVFPKILLNILKDGQCFITTVRNTSTKTVSTLILPNEYCKKVALNQHNLNEISFDFKFFDDLRLEKEQLEVVFKIFPPEFRRIYDEWKKDIKSASVSFKPLDGRFSTCFSLNDIGFPTYLVMFYDIIDYKTYKLNELDRNSAQLDTLVVQEVDLKNLKEAEVVVDDVKGLHEDIAGIADNGRGSRLLTTFGKIKVEQIQGKESIENKTLRNILTSIYDNIGLNNHLFFGDSKEALNFSLKRDLAYVWSIIEKITNFYNLAINNLYNFKNYQLSLTLLPVSPYNEEQRLQLYRQNATLGVGILDYVIASGTKQIDLESVLVLDEKLDLSSRLRPLHSSHTQSSAGSDGAPKEEDRPVVKEPKKIKEEKVEDEE